MKEDNGFFHPSFLIPHPWCLRGQGFMMLGALSPWADHVWRVALPAALGLVAVYLLLPRPRPMLRVAGIALALLGLGGACFGLVHNKGRPVYDQLFYFFAFVAVVS